jgi:hypothetical protein
MGKTMRNFRLDDEVYKAAQLLARHDRMTVTQVIDLALRTYTGLPIWHAEAADPSWIPADHRQQPWRS